MRAASAATIAILALGVFGTGTGTAAAAAPGDPLEVICDNGTTYLVTVQGNGAFTPARAVDSTTVLVPTSFGEVHGVVTDENGNVIDEFTDEPAAKGQSGNHERATTTSCTFTDHFSFPDPDLGLITVHVEGTVTGFVTPVHS